MNSLFNLKLSSSFHQPSNLLLTQTMNQTINQMKLTPKKSVRFSDMCKVVLIPMRHEYSAAGICLWWTKKDFISFRQKYHFEKQKEIELERQLQLELEALNNEEDSQQQLQQQPFVKRNTILIITDQESNLQSLITQITQSSSSSSSPSPNILIRSHEELLSMTLSKGGYHFDAVIIDGTEQCGCFEDDQQGNVTCSLHPINRLSTINVVRDMELSQHITLFVNQSNLNKDKVIRLCCDSSDNQTSDLMILTPDSWKEFQCLIESATMKTTTANNTASNSTRTTIISSPSPSSSQSLERRSEPINLHS